MMMMMMMMMIMVMVMMVIRTLTRCQAFHPGTLSGRCHYYTHFTEEEMEGQRIK